MTPLFAGLLGRLSWQALPHDAISVVGASMIVGVGILVPLYLTITQRWRWLWKEWLTTQDHKRIGIMYIMVSLAMLLRGFSDVVLIRAQQALAVGKSHGIVDSSHFQQIVSAHGTIMIFFVAMGLMFGIINLILPLQIGSRDVAFPMLNATSFWLFFAGMALVNMSLVLGDFSAAGWLAYPPLSELQYSPGTGVDYWIWSLQIAGVGSLLSAVNFITTILTMRAPGMKLMRMPVFVWSVLGSLSLVAVAFPILTVTLALLALDRTIGTHFFTAMGGGNPMMYVNLIWAWGHPEVYILILPAFGIYSEIVPTFSRKRLFGYSSMVWAIGAIVALSFLVWLHHFFTMGAAADVNAFFGIMTMVIAIPTGVKLFNWLFTMYRGRIRMTSPMYWFLGFVVIFTIGGMAGVLMAIPPIDYQLHNSLFLVAHFHMMIIGGVVFGFFAGLTYWFPRLFGFRLHERLGKLAFWCWFLGFLLAFVPLYILGFLGATRRMDHYDTSLGWQPLFAVAGIGVLLVGLGIFVQIVQLIVSIRQREMTRVPGGDPWDGRTLEWSIPYPTPEYNFAIIPTITDRDAWWDQKQHPVTQSKRVYEPITLPRNSGASIIIGICAFIAGFALIWHIWWLAILSLMGLILVIMIRSSNPHPEHTLSAAAVRRLDTTARELQS